MTTNARMPALFLSHGGGPSFLLDGDSFRDMNKYVYVLSCRS